MSNSGPKPDIKIAVKIRNVYHSYDFKLNYKALNIRTSPRNSLNVQRTNSQITDLNLNYLDENGSYISSSSNQMLRKNYKNSASTNCVNNYYSNGVLNNLILTIPAGTIYGLLGPSGCGKTTLLKCITGFIRPNKGSIKIFDNDPSSGIGEVPGKNVGYMPQDYSLYEDLTIEEILTYFGNLYQLDSELIKIRIDQLLELMNLPPKDQLISTLSGGQKRRTSFVCSIIHMPKLIILDEPTVGCDPMLRERIWNQLINFTKNNKMTIIITTHYIEEAKKSDFVGFMKKGFIMAENTPQNLFANYNTNSLEEIFYQLCVTEKIRKGSIKKNNNQKSLIKKSSLKTKKVKEIDIKNIEKKYYFYNYNGPETYSQTKKKSFYQKSINFFKHLKALNKKNIIQTYRKPEVVVAQFIIPLVVVMVFCVCIGSLPRGIPIGIFNQEDCNQTNLCLSEDLISALNSYAFEKIRYDDLEKAKHDVLTRKLLGVINIGRNFSDAIIDKINMDNDSLIIDQSVVTFNGDLTNRIIIDIFTSLFYEDYFDFIKTALVKLDYQPKFGNLPVQLGEEIFGKYIKKDYSSITAYTGPGLLIIIVYSVSFALTGLALLIEKGNGMFERNFVAGVSSNCMLISHLIVNMSLFAFGLFILIEVSNRFYQIPIRGSFYAGFFMLLLQSLVGLSNGLILSAILGSISSYAIAGNGLLLFIFITSGALWPIESMPFYINWIAYYLPTTVPIESLRCIFVRGLPITSPVVYNGYITSLVWSFAMIIGASIIFNYRK